MDSLRFCRALLWLAPFMFGSVMSQAVMASNLSSDLYPIATSPRFLINGSEFPSIPNVRIAPLGEYAQGITKADFVSIQVSGQLINVDATNANDVQINDFAYISCDESAYPGNLKASDVFNFVISSPRTNIIILYSEVSNHCNVSNLSNLPSIQAVFTTVDPTVAKSLAELDLNSNSKGNCQILPDLNSYTNGTGGPSWGTGPSGILGPSPTTAVAMIILYSITGIITALFIVIIVTGAIRAHRHPERYGPRTTGARGRQSRAKGIARAMLETLPIVKFGDHPSDTATKPANPDNDVEMNATHKDTADSDDSKPTKATTENDHEDTAIENDAVKPHPAHVHNADGTQDDGSLGCSICTEDFTKGEEVRVLPCNHKFHPDCVDPWLLNVSGTCPLCRIDLRPANADVEANTAADDRQGSTIGPDGLALPPPLEGNGETGAVGGRADSGSPSGRRDTVASLSRVARGTREERIAALRRFRDERRNRNQAGAAAMGEAESRGLRDRLRERFRIRTTTSSAIQDQSLPEADATDAPRQQSSRRLSAALRPPRASRG